jgi:hypothetical protein
MSATTEPVLKGRGQTKPTALASLVTRVPSSWLLFFGMLAVYLVFFGGHYVVGDNAYSMAWAKALLDQHSNNISAYFPGETYSQYGIGNTLIHIPFLLVARGIQRVTGIACEGPVNMFLYVLNGAAACVLVQRILTQSGLAPRAAFWRAAIVGVASVWFPYSKLEYSESLVATTILAMWYFAPRRPVVAGLLAGFAVSLRIDSILWVFLTLLIAPGNHTNKIRLTLSLIPGVLLTALSYWIRTGALNVYGSGAAGFNNPLWLGVYGILFSAGKSIFLFSPLLLLIGAAWRKSYLEPATRRLAIWALALFAGQLLFYSMWWDWSGDDSWGVRFMITSILALHIIVMASANLRSKLFQLLVILGLLVQLPAVMLGPHTSLMLDHIKQPTKANIYTEDRSPITIDDLRFHPRYSQITATWELFATKLTKTQPRSPYPVLLGSTWSEGFREPPAADWDIFWLNLRNKP